MKLISWLFMRPALLVAVLAAISIMLNEYVMRTGVAHSKDYGQEQHEQHTDTSDKVAHAKDKDGDDITGASDKDADVKAEDEESMADQSIDAAAQMVQGDSDTQGVTAEEKVAVVSVESADQAAQELEESTGDVAKEEQAAVMEKVSTADGDSSAPVSLLKKARTAFWAGDLEEAVTLYKELVAQTHDPAYKHELANVYSKQKNAEQAVPLYVELAPWLAENGQIEVLQEIHFYVNQQSPDQAAQISQFLEKK